MSETLHYRAAASYFGRVANAMHTLVKGKARVWVVGDPVVKHLEIRWSLGSLDFALVEDRETEQWVVRERHGSAFAVEPGGRPQHLVSGIALDEDVVQIAMFALETSHAWSLPAGMLTERFRKDFEWSKLRDIDSDDDIAQQAQESTTLLQQLASLVPDSDGDLIIPSEIPSGRDPTDYAAEDLAFMERVRSYLARYGEPKGVG